jgi:hypothetical protein
MAPERSATRGNPAATRQFGMRSAALESANSTVFCRQNDRVFNGLRVYLA